MPANSLKAVLVQGFKTWALPRLPELPESEWDEAIQKAQATDFDVIERIAMILGVVAVVYLLRIETGSAPAIALPVIYLVQFVEASFLLILLVSPFYLRRARRGLDLLIAEHEHDRKPQL